jgi:hypothetical protein
VSQKVFRPPEWRCRKDDGDIHQRIGNFATATPVALCLTRLANGIFDKHPYAVSRDG